MKSMWNWVILFVLACGNLRATLLPQNSSVSRFSPSKPSLSLPLNFRWFGSVIENGSEKALSTDSLEGEEEMVQNVTSRNLPTPNLPNWDNLNLERHFCGCLNESSSSALTVGNSSNDVMCKCIGEEITEIPEDLTLGVSQLYLYSIGIKVLTNNSLLRYSSSLQDLYFEAVKSLQLIESGAFKHLTHLRTVYIKQAPALTEILDGVFWGHFPRFKILRIVHSGLEILPSTKHLKTSGILSILDFDSNQLRNISTSSVHANAETLILDYNNIEFVERFAFSGSNIAKLSLKGNRKLTYIDDEAFVGLKSLRKLDLSETSISKLPTKGLQDLEMIRIEDTTSLKFPATQDPEEYAYRAIKEKSYCIGGQAPPMKAPSVPSSWVTTDEEPVSTTWQSVIFGDARSFSLSPPNPDESSSKGKASTSANTSPSPSPTSLGSHALKRLAFGIFYLLGNIPASKSWLQEQRLASGHGRVSRCNNCLTRRTRRDIQADGHNSSRQHLENGSNRSINYGRFVFESNLSRERNSSAFDILEDTLGPSPGFGKVDTTTWPKMEPEEERTGDSNEGEFDHTTASVQLEKPIQAFCGEFAEIYLKVKCLPEPDAFNPCEDVMGNLMLRISDWIVAIAAVLGNLAVMIVLMSGRFSMTVSKFLMCNLAFADFCMGLYLLIIAIIDVRTIGVYFNHAIDWQHGLGCKVTGFITVFASELSIFTLTVITLERWHAITYAIHLNRRLKLSLAMQIMMGGWLYAILVASLPLFGVSGYSKTSICLPMENRNAVDLAYLILLLTTNALAFLLISGCYAKMYLAIISQRTRAATTDMTIAKRMALLVFTDFACWAPIAFFGLTAVAGYPLINVTNSKILLVFFYPLNSCANPFLYAILTKQYRRDFFILASRYGFCTERAMRYKGTSSNCHHQRIFSPKAGGILRRNALHGQQKQVYMYKSRCSLQQNSCSDDNSGLSVIYSAIDMFPDSSVSYDSSHEIVRMEYFLRDDSRHLRPKNRKNCSSSISQSSSEESSSSVSKRSRLIFREAKNMHRLPSSEREEILRKVLGESDRFGWERRNSPQRNDIHKSHKNCTSWIQSEVSSGEKSSSNEEEKLKPRTKRVASAAENASYVQSSHSNSAGEDIEL